MSVAQSAKGSNRRVKKKEVAISSDDESIEEVDDIFEEAESSDKSKDNVETLCTMTEEEMAQHLKLCMKLSVENKINMKNAFGLHLIEIMQKIVKKSERADIQQASLSLQASSKIYAGRVEALYQDTFRFHGHLQSIVSGGKKEKKNKNAEDDINDMDDDSEKGRHKPQKNKCKSFLKSEESLTIEQDVSTFSKGEPHGNFVTINSAFSTSRLAPKLLNCLQAACDSCMLRCAISESCFKPRRASNNVSFGVSPKLEGILEKIKKFSIAQSEFQALLASTEGPFMQHMSTPKPPPPPLFFNGDDDGDDPFDAPCNDPTSLGSTDDADIVESAVEKFDVLNITADVFVNDISAAVTNQGFDHKLLPPNSALKKMLDKSRRSSVRPSVGKSTRRKIKEPFFVGRSASDIKHLFVKGRASCISQKILSEWTVENTSNIDLAYEFIEQLDKRKEEDIEYEATLEKVLDVIKQNDLQYHFKYYFNKQSQMWKITRRKLCLNESFPGTSLMNQTEKRVASMGNPNDPEGLALSFQNLSIHESIHEEPLDCGGNTSDNEPSGVFEPEDQQFIIPAEPFETDIEELMVKPPELVRPASMKFDKRPVNLNTEKIKDLLWKIISRHLEVSENSDKSTEPFVLFSKVYEELKIKLEREISEFISMQFAFVVLLILANQKTLLIENVKENTDISIKQDISEIEVTDNI